MAKAAEKTPTPDITHNSSRFHPVIVGYFETRVDIDKQRKRLTKQMADAREIAKTAGLDTKALDAEYAYYKKKNHERDGYDETVQLTHEALNAANTGDLFAPLFEVDSE